MTLEESLAGKEIPEEIKKNLILLRVRFFSFEEKVEEGELVIHHTLAPEVQGIFGQLLEMRFPIQQIVPIVAYGWDDGVSMAANNSSAFNYRLIAGTDRLSNHSYGRAIDINPIQNPYVLRNGVVVPSGAMYEPTQKGTVTRDVVNIFTSYGWRWGGDWIDRKDWQHFEKPV